MTSPIDPPDPTEPRSRFAPPPQASTPAPPPAAGAAWVPPGGDQAPWAPPGANHSAWAPPPGATAPGAPSTGAPSTGAPVPTPQFPFAPPPYGQTPYPSTHAPLPRYAPTEYVAPRYGRPPSGPPNRTVPIIVAVVLVLMFLLGVGLVLRSLGSSAERSATTNPVPSSTPAPTVPLRIQTDGLVVFDERFGPNRSQWYEGSDPTGGTIQPRDDGLALTPSSTGTLGFVSVTAPFHTLPDAIRAEGSFDVPPDGVEMGAELGCIDAASSDDPSPFNIRVFVTRTGSATIATSDSSLDPKEFGSFTNPDFRDVSLTCVTRPTGVDVRVLVDGQPVITTTVAHAPTRGRWRAEVGAIGPGTVLARRVTVVDPLRPAAPTLPFRYPDEDRAVIDQQPTRKGWNWTLDRGFSVTQTTDGLELRAETRGGSAGPEWADPDVRSVFVESDQTLSPEVAGARGGVGCDQSTPDVSYGYQFLLAADGAWEIDRLDDVSGTGLILPMRSGRLGRPVSGSTPVGLACVEREDGLGGSPGWDVGLVQVTATVDGVLVGEALDVAPAPMRGGWSVSARTGDAPEQPYTVETTRLRAYDISG